MSTNESPNKKRRISQACETCRKRKSKCDGGHPVCSICLSNDRICTYDQQGRKRGLQSGYVRSMETILGILVQDLPEVESKVRILLRSAEIGDKIVTPSLAETVTTAWHSSSLHEDVKVLLNHAEDGTQGAIDFLPNIEALDASSATVQSHPTSESGTANVNSIHPRFDEDTTVDIFENASELIELYFLHIHYMFPMVERRDILYILHTVKDHSTMTSVDKGHFVCLLSMLALTLVYVKQVPEASVRIQQTLTRVNLEIGNASQFFELGHIQAVLLQNLLRIHLGQYDASWISLGQASRQIAIYTEKHHSGTSRISHVMQTCNILDTFVSTMCGRSSHVLFDSHPQSSVDENGLEEWEEWQISTTSSRVLASETRLPVHALSVFSNITYIMSRLHVLDPKTLSLRNLKSELEHLQSWWKTLPTYCNPPDPIRTPPSVIHLQLFYHFAIITVSVKLINSATAVHALKDAARSTLDLIERLVELKRSDFAFLAQFALHCLNCLGLFSLALENSGIKELEHRFRALHSTLCSPVALAIIECEVSTSQPELTESQCIQRPLYTISEHSTTPTVDPGILQRTSCDQLNTIQSEAPGSADIDTIPHAEATPFHSPERTKNHEVIRDASIGDCNMIEKEFETLLDTEMEAFLDANFSPEGEFESAGHSEFVQNLGFLEGSMDAEFLALINHDFGPT